MELIPMQGLEPVGRGMEWGNKGVINDLYKSGHYVKHERGGFVYV